MEKKKSISIILINISFIVFGIVGVLGSAWNPFDMVKYTTFLTAYSAIWIPVVLAVGAGTQTKNYLDKKFTIDKNL